MDHQSGNRYPVLKMPLDLSDALDMEVYRIFSGFKSGVEAKNFLCSAVVYYARSPLVLSANALVGALDKVGGKIDSVLEKLGGFENGVGAFRGGYDIRGIGDDADGVVDNVDKEVSGDGGLMLSGVGSLGIDDSARSALASLKSSFKV
jgi:hypothetical protein